MNVEHEDEEFTAVDVESRGSEHNKQSNDPPLEFTGTKPSEFKSCRKKVNCGFFHTHSISVGMPATDWNQRMWPLTLE